MIEFNPIQKSQMPRREKIVQRLWELMRPLIFGGTFWFARKWRLHVIRLVSRVGGGTKSLTDGISLSRRCRIDYPWHLAMNDNSSLKDGVWAYCLDNITIGKNCCISEDVRLLTGSHSTSSPHFNLITKPITIHDNVWIATGAMILPGVTLGEGCIVGTCSVVTHDVEPWTIVAGNPAKFIKRRILTEE